MVGLLSLRKWLNSNTIAHWIRIRGLTVPALSGSGTESRAGIDSRTRCTMLTRCFAPISSEYFQSDSMSANSEQLHRVEILLFYNIPIRLLTNEKNAMLRTTFSDTWNNGKSHMVCSLDECCLKNCKAGISHHPGLVQAGGILVMAIFYVREVMCRIVFKMYI